ncbi:MAG: ATP synthase F1 subunit epsilon [Chloroflexi bacterium]|jgi:F-type H+-transporting ATPase subunit epsilon|nr:ATP synthase F1 subunit epsilon [Chloroflexota bacterium]MDP7197090.1 ATP synthase F1 subunit epsilon [SAR202 cluster bacterium]|tara:strand:+ start:7672 stop:7914 length:243 start_codon:yes stop_codon:yes gene_type:complete
MSFEIDIISQNGLDFTGNVDSVTLPGKDGYITVLQNHASLVTTLKSGKLITRSTKEKEKTIEITGGFSEIKNNKLIVLID